MRSQRTRQAIRNGFESAAAQIVAHDLSKQFGVLLGKYVEPTSFCFNPATGYWAYQDVQRFSGHFRTADGKAYSLGSWEHTLSSLAKSGCHIIDQRGNHLAETEFLIKKGRKPEERDDSDEWYSDVQLEEIAYRKGQIRTE